MININIPPIDIDIKINIENKKTDRYISAPIEPDIEQKYLKYRNAKALANDLNIVKNSRHFVFVTGSFYFGDLIEALCVKNDWSLKKMTISTLSLNSNNVSSLANLLKWGYVEELNLIVSDGFFSDERNNLIPFIYEECDIDNKFQLASARTHCKICVLETACGLSIVMHGSANLRSSGNIEQVQIEENKTLYDFINEVQDDIIDIHKTINKGAVKLNTFTNQSVLSSVLWREKEEVIELMQVNKAKKVKRIVRKR